MGVAKQFFHRGNLVGQIYDNIFLRAAAKFYALPPSAGIVMERTGSLIRRAG